MVKFSIKDLERISGVKAHTIRIWEQRYHIIRPQRSDTNIRFYTNEDLKRLLNISILNNHGVKISKIAQLNDQQIYEEVRKIVNLKQDHTEQVDALVMAMIELDEGRFEEIVSQNIEQFGFLATIEHTIYPFFERIGILWQTGVINPAQEHFVSNLIRQKIIVSIDAIKTKPDPHKKTFLLFLPEGELHEIGLLVYSYILRSTGHKVIYLGQSVPYDDFCQVCLMLNPHAIVTIVTNPFPIAAFQEYINKLGFDFAEKQIIVSGYQFLIESVELPSNIRLFKDLSAFKSLV